MRPSHLLNRKFIYKYPQFGNGPRPLDEKHWKDHPEKIKQTSKGIRWDQSVFYWWFEYLLRNEQYEVFCRLKREGKVRARDHEACLFELYKNWGDVHLLKDDFRTWFFDVGWELFCEPMLKNKISRIGPNDDSFNEPDFLQLSIPLSLPTKILTKQFGNLLEKHQGRGVPQIKPSESRAKYPVYTKPDVAALSRDLQVWDMKNKGAKAPEIHEKIFGKLTDRQIIKLLNIGTRKIDDKDVQDIKRYRTQRYYNVVKRAYNKAQKMVDNTAFGLFPCVKQPTKSK